MMLQPTENYHDFVASKLRPRIGSGIEVSDADINPAAFPFQCTIIRWAVRLGRCAVFADCGLGKSLIQLEFARLVGKRVLILAPLTVAEQTISEGAKFGISVSYVRGPEEMDGDGIFITNYERIERFVGVDVDGIVLDECFPAGTMIDTPDGPRPIETLRRGDLILNAAGLDEVADIHRREVPYAVRVTVDGRPIISSPNHPYFTQRGWVGAQDLEPGDSLVPTTQAVRMVRGDVSEEVGAAAERVTFLQQVLFSEMADAATGDPREGAFTGSRGEARAEEARLVGVGIGGCAEGTGAGPASQAVTGPGGLPEDLPPIERDRARSFRAWGKWTRLDGAAGVVSQRPGGRVDGGVCCIVGPTDSRLSNELQARLGESRAASRYRGGWTLSQFETTPGPQEGREVGFARVDGLEVLEPGHPDLERFRDADGCLYFYDIGATRHPSFSVHGHLVHNSSILKSIDGKTRTLLIDSFQHVPFRLCCTATPAPNDIAEMANHSAFLGYRSREEMLATFFVHDADGWRLKGHAAGRFYEWLASWAVYLRKPSDIGFTDEGYSLPPLDVRQVTVPCEVIPEGHLFPAHASEGIVGRSRLRRETLDARVAAVVDLVRAEAQEQFIIWTGLNDESDALARALGAEAVQVEGNTKHEDKLTRLQAFIRGEARVLVTKAKVAGFGMNFQHAARMVFCGIGDSWEQYYQCIRRCWRFGQKRGVVAYVVTSDAEDNIVNNVMRKEEEATAMGDMILANIGDLERTMLGGSVSQEIGHGVLRDTRGASFHAINGDCVEGLRQHVPDDSIHMSVYSPPFANLYTYSDSPRDMGNSAGFEDFFSHFAFFVKELLRVTMPGRLTCVHVAQIAAQLAKDGYIGIKDFRGKTIEAFEAQGWVFHREVCIDKDPQAQAIRTHSKALLFVQMRKDRSWSGPALADYILVFRKPGDNPVPIQGHMTNDQWIEWARPIWYGIRESDTLNVQEARSEKDERHICPLQLGVIERCVRLWSNPGETILSPFMGIGSEGYQALLLGRRFVGTELKPEYYDVAVSNLKRAEYERDQDYLFSLEAE